MVEALRAASGTTLLAAASGWILLWATLPPGVDAERLVLRAIDHGVIYVAGEAFFVNGAGQNLPAFVLVAGPGADPRGGHAARRGGSRGTGSRETSRVQAAGSPPPHPATP